MVTFSGPEGVGLMRWTTICVCIKSEARGLRFGRGPTATTIAKRELGLKRNTPWEEVLVAAQARRDELAAVARMTPGAVSP